MELSDKVDAETHPRRGGRRRRESSRRQGADSFFLVVDVPVIMPQIQFIHRRLVFQLWRRDKYPQYSSRCSSWRWFLTCPLWRFDRCLVRWCRKLWFSRSCTPSSLAVDFPFALQRLNPMFQTVQQIIETPQLQYVARWSIPVWVVQILRCRRGEDARAPTVAVHPQVLCGSNCRKLWSFRSCSSSLVVDFSCRGAEADSHGLAVQQTMVIPRLHFLDKVIDDFVCVSCRFSQVVCNDSACGSDSCSSSRSSTIPCRGAEADSHGPACLADLSLFCTSDRVAKCLLTRFV